MRFLRYLAFALALSTNPIASAQTADLSGIVTDSTRAVIVGARVALTRESTGARQTTSSNHDGLYSFPFLPPGVYTVSVEATRFGILSRSGVKLDPGQQARLDFTLAPARVQQEITVIGSSSSIETQSSAVGTEVDSRLVHDLPLNGRTFQSLIALAPGVVTPTTLNGTASHQSGIFVNGQRGTSNYFTIDGVSANVGINADAFFPGSAAGGVGPALTVLGTTHDLVSIDGMQEFKLQTSTYSAAYGRAGGGQLEIVTRSGTNNFHGAAYDYFRNEALDANDWFANSVGEPRAAHRQNDFGGTFGGPILHDRTFFFASYEGLRLHLPFTVNTQVPSLEARQVATGAIQQLMNAFPLPTGPADSASMLASFIAPSFTLSTSDNGSIRVDQIISSKVFLFARFSEARSSSSTQSMGLTTSQSNYRSLTVGATASLSSSFTTDLRVNYARSESSSVFDLSTFGGAIPPPDSLLFPPSFASSRSSLVFITMGGQEHLRVGRGTDDIQRQINVVSNSSKRVGPHDLKFGVDYRYLDPHYGPFDYRQDVGFGSVKRALTGIASDVTIQSFESADVGFHDISIYAEDIWRARQRLTFNYGLRWEINPAPYAKGKQPLLTLTGFPDFNAIALAPPGMPVYQTRYTNFAPRFGAAYELVQHPGRELVVRGGFGTFYDLGIGNIGSAAASFPYLNGKFIGPVPYPLSSDEAAPPPAPSLTPPYSGTFNVFAPGHTLPRSYQWNLTLEQKFGTNQMLSASYVGEAGRKLLRETVLDDPNPMFLGSEIIITNNASSSDYHALQLQFQRRMARGLAALASYTWSHSTDDTSDDEGFNDLTDPRNDHGPSDFDIRHSLSAALTYAIPTPASNRVLRATLGNWSIANIFVARTALPVNVFLDREDLNPDPSLDVGTGQVRPDRVPGVPLYIADPTVAGGLRFNPAAFTVSTDMRQGTLSRNALRGFPLSQLDLALWRQFGITEKAKLQFRIEAFNVFNHPNFGAIDSDLGSFGPPLELNPEFGAATTLLAGSGGPIALYNAGGPRSLQLSLRAFF